jgi:dipeptidyl-peptidase 4
LPIEVRGVEVRLKPVLWIRMLLVLPVLLAVPMAAQKRSLTVSLIVHTEQIVSPGISPVAWTPDGKHLTFIRREGSGKEAASSLCEWDVESHTERVLFKPGSGGEQLNLASYKWSPSGDSILFEGKNDLWLLDVSSRQLRRLTHDPDAEDDPTFSPTERRLAFVKKHNLFVMDLRAGSVQQLTSDGSDLVFNGKQDWVYEEELANRATGQAYEWSPDGKAIAYLRLNDSPVPEYPITDYLGTHVHLVPERFPQAGDPNPRVALYIRDLTQPSAVEVPLKRGDVEYVAPTLAWTPDSSALCYLTLNRAQNAETVHLWETEKRVDRTLVTEKGSYWINSLEPPYFLPGKQQFLWLSERDGWMHLYLYGLHGKLLRQVTRGDWMIDRPFFQEAPIFQVDPQANWVYFASTDPDPRERQLYRADLEAGRIERLTREPGTHTLNLSPRGDYLVDLYSTKDVPPSTRLLTSRGSLVALVDKPANHLDEFALSSPEFLEIKAQDGITLYAAMLKPPDFDQGRKYPVIVNVYGGPHVQLIQNHWGLFSWLDRLLAQEGFIVWSLDNRGSWGRGHAFESVIFKDMGRHELEDQLVGVDYLKSQPYVDGSRIGIWGWSYGGYMTLYSLTYSPGTFKCGVAGAPVTDWKFYDSIYTERYMRTPEENPEGYKSASPLEAAANLQAKLLLIHGTADDNVHMQNTINFLQALIAAGKPYELHLQPAQKHGFRGDTPLTYVDERIIRFFEQNL